MKEFNNTTDNEKHVLREHQSWLNSDAPSEVKLAFVKQLEQRAIEMNIQHLLLATLFPSLR